MISLKEPQISVDWIGSEREPVITIDNFAPNPAALLEAAKQSVFEEIGEYYPGVRAKVPQHYIDSVWDTLRSVLREFFKYKSDPQILRSYFSLATLPPHQLSLAQRIPHVDTYADTQIAILHYLCHNDLGGTAFYRQRSTGFETVSEERVETFHRALSADLIKHGEPDAKYIGDESPLFERIQIYEPKYNRALIYRGKALHCAALDTITHLPNDIENGRLTIASFLNSTAG
jgi:Family of unknown function (DUF6445)